ncbi:MAG: flagellar hook-basal body complex protein FliE [candidate division Zixibacteria bacterium]|nr:flagellar hook-basal body complex protein FliE [candidate division Zixibacteria bacterium]
MSNVLNTSRVVPGLIERVQGGSVTGQVTEPAKDGKFSDLVSNLINSVNELQQDSGKMQEAFLAGEPVELHQVMIKAEEAGIATELLLEIRNRLVSAYTEIMRMPM